MTGCCVSITEDLIHEIRKDAKMGDFETKDTNDLFRSISKNKSEQIIFEIKDNEYEEFSKEIFHKINTIRNNPTAFFKNNIQYNSIAKTLGINYNNTTMTDSCFKTKLLSWSTKKARKISDYLQSSNYIEDKTHADIIKELQSLFQKDFKVNGYYSIGRLDNIDKTVLNFFSNSNETEWKEIIFTDYSYCVIHSDYYNKNAIISYLLFLNAI